MTNLDVKWEGYAKDNSPRLPCTIQYRQISITWSYRRNHLDQPLALEINNVVWF